MEQQKAATGPSFRVLHRSQQGRDPASDHKDDDSLQEEHDIREQMKRRTAMLTEHSMSYECPASPAPHMTALNTTLLHWNGVVIGVDSQKSLLEDENS